MRDHFSEMVESVLPKTNETVMDGLAVDIMKSAEEYVDRAFKHSNSWLPPGLRYERYERCTYMEEYQIATKTRTGKRTYNLAPSSVYMVKFFFSFKGKELPPRYIYLPFVGDAGILYMSGVKYHLSPVMSDKTVSVGRDSIFVRTLGNKINFFQVHHSIVVNDARENTFVIWAPVHHKSQKNASEVTTKAVTSVMHYLFAGMGFTEVFRKYAGFVPVVGLEDITPESYPPDRWVIIESSSARTGIKPKTCIDGYYQPTLIKLAVPVEYWTVVTKQFVSGLFYILDHFPAHFAPGYLDDKKLWTVLLGHIVHTGLYGDGKLYSLMRGPVQNLDSYMDPDAIRKLKEKGADVKDFYDLAVYLIHQFDNISIEGQDREPVMYDKSLELLPDALGDITESLRRTIFILGKLIRSRENTTTPENALTEKDVIDTFNRTMTMKVVFGLKDKIISEAVSYCGDCKYPKLTSRLVEQQARSGGARDTGRKTLTDDDHLDASQIEGGSILYLSKNNPYPAARINPFVTIDKGTNTIVKNPDPKVRGVLDATDALLAKKKS